MFAPTRARLAAALGAMVLNTTLAHAAELPQVLARPDTVQTVYDWMRERCATWDVPDASLRAFRDASGGVIAFVSDDKGRLYSGPSLETLRHSCHESLPSHETADPAAHSGLRYVTSTWTSDGVSVTALIHNEYHADHFAGRCQYRASMPCWYTTIIGGHSQDGGRSFQVDEPPKVIAAAPFTQDVEQGRHRGFFNPSNVLFHDGFYYFATNTTGGAGQEPGLCLFRTGSIADPSSWRGYDGEGFSARAVDPYRPGPESYHPCARVVKGTVGSITRHRGTGLFLLIRQTTDPSRPNGKTVYSWSPDLIHWSEPKTLLDEPDLSSTNCGDRFRYGYPSLLDPKAPGRNFDETGDAAYLFLTRLYVSACKVTAQRDLIRMEVSIGASGPR